MHLCFCLFLLSLLEKDFFVDMSPVSIVAIFLTLLSVSNVPRSEAQLSPSFYNNRCPNALNTIRKVIKTAISRERRMAASLLRLHFHDCFVQGCDGSLFLDNGPSIQSEKNALQNLDSVRGFEVIDQVKSSLEKICPGVVSCADILAVAARDASAIVGGPTWAVKLGRRDSKTASKTKAEADLPQAADSLNQLLANFRGNGLNSRDMVALSGAHTIGQAQCVTFRARLYNNDTNIDAGFKITRRRNCPANGGDGNPASLDLVTPKSFDNIYFKNLVQKKGLLHSDQVLFSGGSTDKLVSEYSRNSDAFYSDFAAAMIKMGNIRPLTGSSGQIRRTCRRPN